LRLRLVDLDVRIWLAHAFSRLIFLLAVAEKRFFTPLLVRVFGMG
jgi:hypothetical protein